MKKHKSKKKYSRYQLAGDNISAGRIETPAEITQFSGVDPSTKDILHFLLSPQGQQLVDQYKKAGYQPKADDSSLSFERDAPLDLGKMGDDINLSGDGGIMDAFKFTQAIGTIGKGGVGSQDGIKNPVRTFFAAFNPAARIATNIGNQVKEIKNRKDEFRQYQESILQRPYENFDEQGLNPSPIYFKNGGKWIPNNLHKGRCTPGSPNYDCPKGSPQWRLAQTFKKHHGFHKSQYGFGTDSPYFAQDFAQKHNLSAIANSAYTIGPPKFVDEKGNPFISKVQKPKPTTVPSDIQLGDIQSEQGLYWYVDPHTGDIVDVDPSVVNLPRFKKAQSMEYGGETQAMLGVDTLKFLNSLAGYSVQMPYGGGPLTAEGAKEILRDGTVHGKKLTEKQRRYFGYIAGGGKSKHQTGGDESDQYDTPAIEAEEGEVYKTPDDEVKKVPEGGGTHEEGGVIVNDAERVLEDTSDKRKDFASKLLKLSPDTAEFITGIRPKSPVTHSKALEIASAQYGKDVKRIQSKIKNSLDSLKRIKTDKYATNSIDLNLKLLSQIPESDHTFNNLFEHQETLKALVGIDAEKAKWGKMNKYKVKKSQEMLKAQVGIENAPRLHGTEGWEFLYTKGSKNYYRKQDGSIVTSDGPKMSDADWIKFLQSESPAHKQERIARQQGTTNYGYTQGIAGIDLNYPTAQMSDINVNPQDLNMTNIPEDTEIVNTQRSRVNIDSAQPKSQFNEPLNWFDVAGPLDALASSGRIPAKYNPRELHQIRLQLQNPLPSLQEGQRNYNEALGILPNNGVGYSNVSDLFSKKYGIDTSILGQYENINKGIKNQEIMYNSKIKDEQSLANQQSREVFEQKYLGSIEAQRQQRLTALDDLYTRIAQNKKLNREGSLLMQLFPAYDQFAQRNSYKYNFRNPIGFPQGTTGNLNAQQILQAKQIIAQAKKEGRIV